jgi:hypothetical protein
MYKSKMPNRPTISNNDFQKLPFGISIFYAISAVNPFTKKGWWSG